MYSNFIVLFLKICLTPSSNDDIILYLHSFIHSIYLAINILDTWNKSMTRWSLYPRAYILQEVGEGRDRIDNKKITLINRNISDHFSR